MTFKCLIILGAVVFGRLACMGQGFSNARIWRDLAELDSNRVSGISTKLQLMYEWKKKAEHLRLPQDSVYARLLHKIGSYEFDRNNYNAALGLTLKALRINLAGTPGSSPTSAVTDLYNIALYYNSLELHRKAINYYDSAILFAKRYGDVDDVIMDARADMAWLYFRLGDYQQAVEEGERSGADALEQRDSVRYLIALNQRVQALFFEGRLAEAQEKVRAAVLLARRLHREYDVASALKIHAFISASEGDRVEAEAAFRQSIAARFRSRDIRPIPSDYSDFGVFYSDKLKDFQKAANCQLLALQYARKAGDSIRMSSIALHLGQNYFSQRALEKAGLWYLQAMSYLKIGRDTDITFNPRVTELSAIVNRGMLQSLFIAKTELLLEMYRQTQEKKWLGACLQTALLNDSLIRAIRHEQLGEESKLYWRKSTRGFFSTALEACYWAGDDRLAFFFMEESRSVMLQDKLNELGASAYLPAEEAAKQEQLQITILELQQKLKLIPDTSGAARKLFRELLVSKEALEKYIRSLEGTYPVYYQYKYADEVKHLSALQEFLSKNKQSFVEYFVEDSVCYALCVQAASTRLLRIGKKDLEGELAGFVRLCSDENALSRGFAAFLASANGLYQLLFEPFHLPAGRVIICQDNELVPFEALSRDSGKAEFLIKDYSFSYVYSARYLLNQREQAAGSGDFLGIAPVSFAGYKGMADLRLSEEALRSCSAPYGRTKLLLRGEASRQNFMRRVGDYSVTTILTHARADTSDEEPLLFLNDSVIRLSELQMLRNPAARLVVLSACQTNAGKNRNGEGVFSLARGFSAAGIPAVAATQWMADEAAIYSISQKLNEYLAQGMNKDEALRKAKLYYMFEDKKGSVLPCYWADMILIGNTEPVTFSKGMNLWWVAGALGIGLVLGFVIARLSSGSYGFSSRRRKARH
jgi:CHAT domain-containing protein/tetratricopeptide (TPR) repeat protein